MSIYRTVFIDAFNQDSRLPVIPKIAYYQAHNLILYLLYIKSQYDE